MIENVIRLLTTLGNGIEDVARLSNLQNRNGLNIDSECININNALQTSLNHGGKNIIELWRLGYAKGCEFVVAVSSHAAIIYCLVGQG